MTPTTTRKKSWYWIADAEVRWRRWGLGVELACGFWVPREWSIYLHLGPLLMWAGIEQDDGY